MFSKQILKDFEVFVEEYKKLGWLQQLFVPSSLDQAINLFNSDPNLEHLLSLVKEVLNNTWFFQRWIVSCLGIFSSSPLIQACNILQTANLLEQNNFNQFNQFYSDEEILSVMNALDQKSLFSDASAQVNFDTVCEVTSSKIDAVDALFLLKKNGMLEQRPPDYQALVFAYANENNCSPSRAAKTALVLYLKGLLSRTDVKNGNFNPKDKESFPEAVLMLLRAGLLDEEDGQENLDVILNRQYNASEAAKALVWLNNENLLQTNIGITCRLALIHFPLKVNYIISPINNLLKSGLLSEPNCNALFSVYKMALNKEKESKEEYCYRIATKIQSFLCQYADSTIRNFLTQNIFDKIISLSKSYLMNINDDSVFQSLIDELNRLHTPSKTETQEQTLGMMSLTN